MRISFRPRFARPILEDLWSWLEEQEPQCSPGRALHKAIVYALSHRVELSRFLEDGAVPLDNNVCERAIKNVVNATMFDRYGDADDFLDCFIMPARIVGGTFQG